MDASSQWQSFAATGDIRYYLDYKRQAAADAAAQEGTIHGCDRNAGAGASGSEIPRGG